MPVYISSNTGPEMSLLTMN